MQSRERSSELEEVVVTHHAHLCHIAMKIVGTRERADEVVQDTYLKIAEAGMAFNVKRPIAYVCQVVRNLALDRYRRGALESGIFTVEDEGINVPAPSATPEAVAINRQDLQRVYGALNELPTRTRCAFELYRSGGYTQREIAEQLEVSTTLVNFMIRDALAHCRKALRGH